MAKDEGESFDFDDLALPGGPLDLNVEAPAAVDEPVDETAAPFAPLDAQPSLETAAAEERPAETSKTEDVPEDAPRPSRPGFWQRLSKADLYTVMLGMALLAVTIAVLCLVMELAAYQFDIKATGGKATSQQLGWAVQSGRATTMPAA